MLARLRFACPKYVDPWIDWLRRYDIAGANVNAASPAPVLSSVTCTLLVSVNLSHMRRHACLDPNIMLHGCLPI